MTEDEYLSDMEQWNEAMEREDVIAYMALIESDYRFGSSTVIPDRFKPLDEDEDGYLSFEELLKSIDQFFDFQLDLSLEELREANEFFFSQ